MRDHSVFRDGIVAGVIGATAMAVWFLVVDLRSGVRWTLALGAAHADTFLISSFFHSMIA